MSVTEEYLRQKREQQENLRLKIADTVNHDADRAARILRAGSLTGLPFEVIDSDLDNVEERVRQRDFDPEKYRKDSPVFATFAAENPYNLSVLKDDLENMSAIERAWTPLSMGWDSGWAKIELGRIRSRHVGGDVREGDEERLNDLRKYMQPHEFGAGNFFSKFLVKNAKMMPTTIYSTGKGIELGLGGASVGAAAGALAGPGAPLTIPATAAIGFGVGMVTGTTKAAFDLERAFAYDEYLELGLDPESARVAANAVGTVNAALESFGISQAVKYMPGFSAVKGSIAKQIVSEILVRPTFKRAAVQYVGRFGEVLGSEVITEVLQESATVAAGEILKSQQDVGTAMTWDEYTDRVADIATETMQGAFILSSLGPSASYISDVGKAKRANQNALLFKVLGESAEASSTRENVPEKFREFVERVKAKGPIETIGVDAERFIEYFQDIGQDPDQVAAELGIDLNEAQTVGTDISIPIDVYADKIAPTEHHEALLPDLRMREDDMTLREAEEWHKNADEIQKALAAEEAPEGYKAVPEIHEEVLGELIGAGVERTAAEKQASLYEHVFSTLAERNNMDPVALFNRYFGGVRRDKPDVLQQGGVDINMMVDPLLDQLRSKKIPSQRDILGASLTDFLTAKGGLIEEGGELAAMDLALEFPKLMKGGKLSLDAAAELASEAGFIPEYDLEQLKDALRRETTGEPVFAYGVDPKMAEIASKLEELQDFLDSEGLDLDTMTNDEIKKKLMGDRTLSQDEQDFGAFEFTDIVGLEGTGAVLEVSEKAQKVFNRAVKRREGIQKLMDCVSG